MKQPTGVANEAKGMYWRRAVCLRCVALLFLVCATSIFLLHFFFCSGGMSCQFLLRLFLPFLLFLLLPLLVLLANRTRNPLHFHGLRIEISKKVHCINNYYDINKQHKHCWKNTVVLAWRLRPAVMPAEPTALVGMFCSFFYFFFFAALFFYFFSFLLFVSFVLLHILISLILLFPLSSFLFAGVAEKAIDFLEGKRPSSIAAASVLFIFQLLRLQNKVNELANVASISPNTLRSVYKEICKVLTLTQTNANEEEQITFVSNNNNNN